MTRILVVEDDPDIRLLVALRLRSEGYEVAEAAAAEQALEWVDAEGLPDLAMLDVELPGMDGFELLRELQSRGVVPAVFLTARVIPEDVAKGIALGATYLTKPFGTEALLTAVSRPWWKRKKE